MVDLLRLIHRGKRPIKASELMAMGLHKVTYEAALLVGLDRQAATAVLVAVIAERRR